MPPLIVGLLAAASIGEALASPPVEPVAIEAHDGIVARGDYYPAYNARALLLLFHQAGSSREEYATVAPRLAQAGFSVLAVDMRSGGELYGRNETVAEIGASTPYVEARADIEAALAWSRRMELPVFLVGSSYSSSLVLEVAADHPDDIAGVVSFSPGEYLGPGEPVRTAAGHVRAPVLVVTTAEAGEVLRASPIVAALRQSARSLELEQLPDGKHGASTLIETVNPKGAQQSYGVLLRWLLRQLLPTSSA